MLALGLSKSLVATAYLDDVIDRRYRAEYEAIPTRWARYPSHTELEAVRPDFLFGSYSTTTLKSLTDEVATIAAIFNVSHRASAVFAEIASGFDLASNITAHARTAAGRSAKPPSVLWLDSWSAGSDTVFVGACCGTPALIMQEAGFVNVARDIGNASQAVWADMTWEQVVAADPDVIVLVSKLCNASHPASNLTAVRKHRLITIPFSSSTMGVKVGSAVVNLAVASLRVRGLQLDAATEKQLVASGGLGRFSSVSEVQRGFEMAFTSDGTGYFLALPAELHAVCPLEWTGQLPSGNRGGNDGNALSDGAIAGIVVGAVVGVALLAAVVLLGVRYRSLRGAYEQLLESGSARAGVKV
ncbi:hypothetical protein HYH02_012855 [Chlamydomonas schloesseri]|uniref:Fe/B12 periplasmic-binding domain-containing protein n=1 Tax=Chlamydomonas schloesseri TaxID=2026947 RepID=A0A835SVS9_9CHLO|nr:hypothetical protein HYH02_012855 [Chlamydomonas schloesseri]|eukprot:KAG2432721.1 hypothetical protein HYH02_012855 [Chlamydomonas schloesseri]